MAHELDRNEQTGVGTMFSVKETPWHNEGHVLTEAPNLEEAIKLAGQDFEVQKEPLYIRRLGAVDLREGLEGIFNRGDKPEVEDILTYLEGAMDQMYPKIDTGHEATVRQDRGEVLGVVGGRYHVLQNAEAFQVLEPLLDAGLVTLETGGTLRSGRDVWMLTKFNIDHPVVQEVYADEVIPYGLISNNHAGWRQVVLQNTPIRVVCANTLGMALHGAMKGGQVKIRHTATVRSRLVEEARKFWAAVIERHVAAAEQYKLLKARTLTEEEFTRLVAEELFSTKAYRGEKELTNRQKGTLERLEAKQEKAKEYWERGKGHVGDHSAWEAYNGIVEMVDHDDETFKVRGLRTEALFTGGTLEMPKARVLNNLVKLVGA